MLDIASTRWLAHFVEQKGNVMPRVICWDWKGSIEISELREVLLELGVSVIEINTGSDSFAIVIGKSPMTTEEAEKEYKKHYYMG